jgi:protein-disulfide isomerase
MKSSLKQVLLAAALTSFMAATASGQSEDRAFDRSKKAEDGASVAAVVNGSRVITIKEVDQPIREQIHALKEKIYQLRRMALENLINNILLEEEARGRGISGEELRRSLMKGEVKVKQSQVEEFFASHSEAFGSMSEEEAKQRIRFDLEGRERLERYKAALAAIRGKARVASYIVEPEPLRVEVGKDGPSRGTEGARVTIVEFSDFQCPYCKQATQVVEQVLKEYKSEVRIIFKHLPLPNHPLAFKAAEAAVCAAEQGRFWPYHDRLFGSTDLSAEWLKKTAVELGLDAGRFNACLGSEAARAVVLSNLQEARRLGIQGTPTFIVNGRVLRGLVSVETFKKVIDQELNK